MSPPGKRAERRASWWYRLHGYRVLARNAWAGGYELDLVVRRGGRLVFCEVKEKGGDGFGHPAEMVDAEKQRRIRRAAASWLAAHPDLGAVTVEFEVCAVRGRRLERISEAF